MKELLNYIETEFVNPGGNTYEEEEITMENLKKLEFLTQKVIKNSEIVIYKEKQK